MRRPLQNYAVEGKDCRFIGELRGTHIYGFLLMSTALVEVKSGDTQIDCC